MRQFYREYSESPKLQPLVREISWAKRNTKATYSVMPDLPENIQTELPSPEQIAERLDAWAKEDSKGLIA
jgi:sulfur relay (sulfurtransferase) DsrC/TusE family protein